ncbi:DUF4339 domain-containing protein [Bradyrhizobium sp. SZCCHNR1070]|uniref:DUF4339 domain-containing protein n=1 Tax=Bradyrhizobium sp. SZCCHNR1070 TaxID=3057361 RepID=UPI003966D280
MPDGLRYDCKRGSPQSLKRQGESALSDIWYYTDYKGQVGPVSVQQLKDVLARVSEPASVLVWRDGFAEWKRASDVPEFRAQTLSPPPLPSGQTPTWTVKWWWYIVPFISIGIGSQVGRKVMIWNSAQRRRAKQQRREGN